jgi:hypothetical protein
VTFNVPSVFSVMTYWISCDISASGEVITALSNDNNNIYYHISKDSGSTWSFIDLSTQFNDKGITNIAVN